MPDHSQWNIERLDALRLTPYDEHACREEEVAFGERPDNPDDADAPRKVATSRRLYIKGEDLKAFGYTVGCPRCDHERRYGPWRTTEGHSDRCRERIIDGLMKTPEGQRRVEVVNERVTRAIAEQIEAADIRPQSHGGVLVVTCLLELLMLNWI